MKHKYTKKDKKVKKGKLKKIVKAKKRNRKPIALTAVRIEPPITLGFERSASDPIEPDAQAEIIEPDAVTEAA